MKKLRVISSTIAILIVLIILALQSLPVISGSNLPYKEGDWFKYRVEVSVDGHTCRANYEIRVLEIDMDYERVYVESKLQDSDGSTFVCEYLHSMLWSRRYWSDLRSDYKSLDFLINPSVSGRFELGLNAYVVYDRGVLRELEVTETALGIAVKISFRLVDSSVHAYKPSLNWLIVIGIVVAIMIMIALIIVILRRKARVVTTEQLPPSPQYPEPSQPSYDIKTI